MARVLRYRLRDFLGANERFHLARSVIAAPSNPRHTHDFAEVFWVERGAGIHDFNGHRIPVATGDLVWVQPADIHCFAGPPADPLQLVNLAFDAPTLRFLRQRYAWPTATPAPVRLTTLQAQRLGELAGGLLDGVQTTLKLDWFLLNLLELAREKQEERASGYPEWLQHALAKFTQPTQFATGAAGLARAAGRTPEHVNRVVKQATGRTATDLVNDLRLDHAARELRMTDRKILDLALECGLENLGYFYRLFQRRFGLTPRRYRLRHQALVR